MNQPVLGSQFLMNVGSNNPMSTPNPLSYNYPKVSHFKGSQYSSYPKFKEKSNRLNSRKNVEQNINEESDIEESDQSNNLKLIKKERNSLKYSKKTEELAEKLNEEIKKLEEITNKAKELTKGDLQKNDNDDIDKKGNLKKENSENKLKKKEENLHNAELKIVGDMHISKQEKERFDKHMQEIMDKLSKVH